MNVGRPNGRDDRERGENGEQEATQSVAHSQGRLGNGKVRRGPTLEGGRETVEGVSYVD